MAILGAHESIAGGLDKAIHRATAVGCDCVQLFTKNNNQWQAKSITPQQANEFRQALRESGLSHPVAHDSYLINLASPDRDLWKKSIDAFVQECQRADLLGLPYVITHPGAYTTSSLAHGIARIVQALNEVHAQTRGGKTECLLETTAGQGTSIGWRFEHLAEILNRVKEPERLGVCVDTCHVFAAGYPFGSEKDYEETLNALEATVGLRWVKAVHLNDSKKECGSRVDRHAHIGQGQIGLEPFRLLVNDPRFARVPMYLETPKGMEDGVDLDVRNLGVLRGLVRKRG